MAGPSWARAPRSGRLTYVLLEPTGFREPRGALRVQIQPRPGVSWKEEAHHCPPGPGSVIHSDSSSGAVSA